MTTAELPEVQRRVMRQLVESLLYEGAIPGEVPAGIMTALVGAPVFVWLIRRGKGAGL